MPYKDPQSPKAKASNLKKDRKYKKIHKEELKQKDRDRRKNDEEYRLKRLNSVRKYEKNNREKYLLTKKSTHLKRLYGITYEDFLEIVDKQKGVCAICGKKNLSGKKLFVDHNHSMGKIRGLLCSKCNFALGLLNENIKLLQKMIKYLKQYA